MLQVLLVQYCFCIQLVPEYQHNIVTISPLGTINSPVSFTSPFSNIPQVTINWFWMDMDGGVITYSTKVTSITQTGFILTTFSTQYIVLIIIQWMAFLDDNIHSQAGSIVQYITSQIVNPNIALTNPQAQIPYAAAFLTGVSQTSTTTADNYEYLIMVNSIALTQIQLHINIVLGFAVSQIDYNIIYGSPQYLTAGQHQYASSGTFPLFTIDARTKVSMAGFSELFGSGRVRLKVANNNGNVTIETFVISSIYAVIISYFNYMPCPLYCSTCYTAAPNCDGCLASTYRTGSDCKSCQTQMYTQTGQINCQTCQSYCNECSGSATNCTSCQLATFRVNAPSCTTCPSQMFLQLGVVNCQQCSSYCDQCAGISTSCSNCQLSTLRTGPPGCTTCPLQMFIQANVDNCQQCSVYCDLCTTTATNCTQCNPITVRINPPNCAQCPIQMFIESGIQNCQQCGIYCGQCTLSANNCTLCLTGTHRINLPQCDICQTQYYSISNVIICQGTNVKYKIACANYCNECIQAADNCQACNAGSLRLNPPSCQTCPAQYHLVYNVLNCQPCLAYCNNCQPYVSQCIACSSSSRRLNPPDCLDCPQYYYVNGNICTQCDQSCQTCNSNRCLTCLSNQYIDSRGKCMLCPSHCLTCDINTCYSCANNCADCDQTSCLRCSLDNYYLQGTSCYPCPQYCSTCNAQQCLTCIGPRIPINNECTCQWPCQTCDSNKCLSCISSQYRLQNQICLFCPEKCVACDQNSYCYEEPSNCKIGIYVSHSLIQCTQCHSNHYLSENFCILCSEECLECSGQPSNCSICRFQSLSSLQCQLCESQPGLYSNYQTNTCYSICGDGITYGSEQCDDGNSGDYDGCTNCQIDDGYFCQGILCQAIIYPIPIIFQNTTLDTVYNANKYFILSYNVPITYKHFNIELKITNFTTFDYTITQVNDQSFIISIYLNEQLIDNELQVIFNNINEIVSHNEFYQQINIIYCSISDYIISTSTEQDISDSTNTIMNYLLIIIAIIICLAIAFGGLEIFWNLLDLFQTMSYLKYINSVKPYYLYSFLNLFGFLQFQNLPLNQLFNIQNYVQDAININEFRTPPLLINNDGYTTSTIINIIPLANVIFTAVCLYIFASIILHLIDSTIFLLNPNQLIKNIKVCNYLYKFKYFLINSSRSIIVQFFWSGLIRLFVSSSYEICFTICLGLYGLQFENLTFVIKFDLFITIFLIVCYCFIIFLVSVIANLDTKTLQQKLNEYGAVCEGLKQQYLMKQTTTIVSIRKMLFMIFLVLLYNEPLFQILNILAIQIFQLLFLIILDPISDKKEKQKQVICEFFMLLAEIQLAILVIDDYWILFDYEKRRIFGWICVFALIIIALSQITIDVHQQSQYYYKRYPVIGKYWGLLKNKFSGEPMKQISLQEILI